MCLETTTQKKYNIHPKHITSAPNLSSPTAQHLFDQTTSPPHHTNACFHHATTSLTLEHPTPHKAQSYPPQTRDNIMKGALPVSQERALEFAGLQCQIQYGDYNESKHKPGFLEYVSWHFVQLINELHSGNTANVLITFRHQRDL